MIRILALDSTTLSITCWKDNLARQFLGCSMKEYHFFVEKDNLLCIDKNQEVSGLVNKRQGLVNFTVKDSYKDDKKYINSVSLEWASE